MRYVFLGDRLTREDLRGMACDPVRRADGKCIVSIPMAVALVIDGDGQKHVVPRRRLRLTEKLNSYKMIEVESEGGMMEQKQTQTREIECPYCGGQGYFDDIGTGWEPSPNNPSIPIPVPIPIQIECSSCGGSGIWIVSVDEDAAYYKMIETDRSEFDG